MNVLLRILFFNLLFSGVMFDDESTKNDLITGVKTAVAEGLKPIEDNVKTVSETVKSIEEKQTSLEDRVKKIEDMPLSQFGAKINKTSGKYKGYSLDNTLVSVREKAAKNPTRFKTFANDEKAEEFSKFMIDYVRATALDDIQAKMALQTKASELVEGTESLGGYLVPEEYQNELIMLAQEQSYALQECTVIPMSRDVLKLPTEAGRVSVTWEDEAAAIDESSPEFGQVTLTAKKLAGLTDGISIELLQDSAIDIPGLLTQQFMYAIGLELDNQVFNGTGTPMSGLLTAACGYSVVMSAAAFSSVSADDFSDMIYKLSQQDVQNAQFFFNRLITHYLRILKDTTERPIFTQISAKEPSTIYGLPYRETTKITGTTASSTAFGALGDMKGVYLGRRMGAMSLDSDPYSEFNKALIRFRVLSRWGMAISRSTKFVRLVSGS